MFDADVKCKSTSRATRVRNCVLRSDGASSSALSLCWVARESPFWNLRLPQAAQSESRSHSSARSPLLFLSPPACVVEAVKGPTHKAPPATALPRAGRDGTVNQPLCASHSSVRRLSPKGSHDPTQVCPLLQAGHLSALGNNS